MEFNFEHGIYTIQNINPSDDRGQFVKPWTSSFKNKLKINFSISESFYSISKKNVFRGLHFQKPPKSHYKIVYCSSGSVIDIIVDLRKESYSFGETRKYRLDRELNNTSLLIPPGFAHGFYALEDNTIMNYLVSEDHSPENDSGLNWRYVQNLLPTIDPIVSERDDNLPEISKLWDIF